MRNSNEEMKMAILNRQTQYEYTHTYAIAIRESGMVKACIVENADEVLPHITYCERNSKSHGADWGVRIINAISTFEMLKAYASEIVDLCSVDLFEEMYLNAKADGTEKGNRGNFFETVFTSVYGGTVVDSKNAPCTKSGDMIDKNGRHIQCKFWNATVTTEKQSLRFMEEYLTNN